MWLRAYGFWRQNAWFESLQLVVNSQHSDEKTTYLTILFWGVSVLTQVLWKCCHYYYYWFWSLHIIRFSETCFNGIMKMLLKTYRIVLKNRHITSDNTEMKTHFQRVPSMWTWDMSHFFHSLKYNTSCTYLKIWLWIKSVNN